MWKCENAGNMKMWGKKRGEGHLSSLHLITGRNISPAYIV